MSQTTCKAEELCVQGSGESSTGIWSLAWSPAASEVAAGTSQPGVIVYDLAACRTVLAALCHQDDVNAVAYADPSGNVIVSGSDDTRIFVHDRCGADVLLQCSASHPEIPHESVAATATPQGFEHSSAVAPAVHSRYHRR